MSGIFHKKTILCAAKKSLPVMVCYLFMGMSAGIILSSNGYSFVWSTFLATTALSGTMQYLGNELLVTNSSLINVAIMTFMINFRYLFYGFSVLDRFKVFKKLKPYMVFCLTDETYSIICSSEESEGENRKSFIFWLSFLDHLYWIIGVTTGAVLGMFNLFNSKGIDFIMTALFLTIVIDQLRTKASRIPVFIGASITLVCMLIFPREYFVLVALLIMMLIFVVFRKPLESKYDKECI